MINTKVEVPGEAELRADGWTLLETNVMKNLKHWSAALLIFSLLKCNTQNIHSSMSKYVS